MKRYVRRILLFSLILSLSALLWSGAVVAKTDPSTGNHTTQSACGYNVPDTKIGRAPASFSTPEELVNNTRYSINNHFASGDWLALQLPKSNSSNCSYRDPAGSNMAYADPATPDTNTSHTITAYVNKTVNELEQVSIRYEIRPHLNDGLSQNNISTIGIDENKDGFIEQSLNESVEYITAPDQRTIQITFDRNTTVPSNSYLVLRYNGITNPDYEDTHTIKTTIIGNRTVTDSGFIKYRANRTGLIGSNIRLSIDINGSQLITLRSSKIAFTNDSMYIFLPIQQNVTQPQTYSLSIENRSNSDAITAAQSNRISREINVFGRYAYTFSNAKMKNGTLVVSGYTNISPGSLISIRVFDSGRLLEVGTTVKNSQTWSVEISLPDELQNARILRATVIDTNDKEIDQSVLFVT